jgi:hypothetical protein
MEGFEDSVRTYAKTATALAHPITIRYVAMDAFMS